MVETPSAAPQRSRVGPLEVMASKLNPKLNLPRSPGSPSRDNSRGKGPGAAMSLAS